MGKDLKLGADIHPKGTLLLRTPSVGKIFFFLCEIFVSGIYVKYDKNKSVENETDRVRLA